MKHRIGITGITTAALLGAGWPLAQGALLEHGRDTEVIAEEGVEDYCDHPDHPDLTIDRVLDYEVSYQFKTVGPDGLPLFSQQITYTTTRVNPDNGHSLTSVGRSAGRDIRAVDNGDGTYTVTTAAMGNDYSYDQDGTVVDRFAGLYSWQVLVDNGGTPADPYDDEFVDFLGFTRDFAGHSENEDWCVLVHETLD